MMNYRAWWIPRSIRSTFRAYAQNINGNFSVMFAGVTILIVVSVGIAIDYNGLASKTRKMQHIADSAVLAAAKSLLTNPSELKQIAQDVVDANNTDNDIIGVKLKVVGDVIKVDLDTTYETAIMKSFGKKILPTQVSAEAPIANSDPINVALVLDTTGSMAGANIASLKTAAKGLVDTLERVNNDEIMISVVPFAQYVSLPLYYRDQVWLDVPKEYVQTFPTSCSGPPDNQKCHTPAPIYWEWKGAVGSRTGGGSEHAGFNAQRIPAFIERRRDSPMASTTMLPPTKNYNAVRQKISSLNAQGWTYIPAGLVWGWRAITPHQPITATNSNQKGKVVNAIVLMTDGANTRSLTAPSHNGSNGAAADALSDRMCARIKQEGIHIYTVAYRFGSASSNTKRMLQECASDTDSFLDARNSAQLKDAFHTIAVALYTSRISG